MTFQIGFCFEINNTIFKIFGGEGGSFPSQQKNGAQECNWEHGPPLESGTTCLFVEALNIFFF